MPINRDLDGDYDLGAFKDANPKIVEVFVNLWSQNRAARARSCGSKHTGHQVLQRVVALLAALDLVVDLKVLD